MKVKLLRKIRRDFQIKEQDGKWYALSKRKLGTWYMQTTLVTLLLELVFEYYKLTYWGIAKSREYVERIKRVKHRELLTKLNGNT